VEVVFDENKAQPFNDGWVEAQTQAQAVVFVLRARGIAVGGRIAARIHAERDTAVLNRWLALAATARSVEAFVAEMDR